MARNILTSHSQRDRLGSSSPVRRTRELAVDVVVMSVLVGGLAAGRGQVGSDGRGPEALDDHPDGHAELQARTGAAAAIPRIERSSYSPKRTAVPDAKMSEPPTRPSTAMARGTSRERYIRYASSTVLTPSASFGPKRKVQLWTATSDWPTVTAAVASGPVVPARSVAS